MDTRIQELSDLYNFYLLKNESPISDGLKKSTNCGDSISSQLWSFVEFLYFLQQCPDRWFELVSSVFGFTFSCQNIQNGIFESFFVAPTGVNVCSNVASIIIEYARIILNSKRIRYKMNFVNKGQQLSVSKIRCKCFTTRRRIHWKHASSRNPLYIYKLYKGQTGFNLRRKGNTRQ